MKWTELYLRLLKLAVNSSDAHARKAAGVDENVLMLARSWMTVMSLAGQARSNNHACSVQSLKPKLQQWTFSLQFRHCVAVALAGLLECTNQCFQTEGRFALLGCCD